MDSVHSRELQAVHLHEIQSKGEGGTELFEELSRVY
jgi:hypothetical protein